MSRLGGLGVLIGLAAVVVAGAVAVMALWGPGSSPLRTEPYADPLLVAPVATVSDLAVNSSVTITAADSAPVTVSVAGVVTDVAVELDQQMAAGDLVVSVDDRPVVAFTGAAPLVRPLSRGDTGPDVGRLQAFLNDVGDTQVEVDGRFGSESVAALKRFQRRLGVDDTGRIGPEDVMWIGDGPVQVRQVLVSVGDRVEPGAGMFAGPVVDATAQLSAATSQTPVLADPARPVVLRLPTGPDVAVQSDGTVAPADARDLFDRFGAVESLPASVALAEPLEVVEVPAAAVVSDDAGTCVLGGGGETVAVDVLTIGFGRALLHPGPVDLPDEVVTKPTGDTAACPPTGG